LSVTKAIARAPEEKLDLAVAPNTLSRGNAVYYVPKTMTLGRASRVDLWIDAATPMEELQRVFAKQLGIPPENIKFTYKSGKGESGVVTGIPGVYVGAKMTAHLEGGKDFDIEPDTPVTKSLLGDGRAMWDWRVTPKSVDRKGLVLVIDAWVDIGGNKDAFPSIREEVIVPNPSLLDVVLAVVKKVAEGMGLINTILAALGIGGLSGVWMWLRKRLKRRDETPLPQINPNRF
jgi:hypothetical protein